MIIWGGQGKDGKLNDGARLDLAKGRWLPITTTEAPEARWRFAAIWTGTEMLVWGGDGARGALGDGAA